MMLMLVMPTLQGDHAPMKPFLKNHRQWIKYILFYWVKWLLTCAKKRKKPAQSSAPKRNLPDTKSVTFFPRNTFLLYDHTLFWTRSSDIMILHSFVDFRIKISIYWVVSEGWVAWFPHGWVRSLIVWFTTKMEKFISFYCSNEQGNP